MSSISAVGQAQQPQVAAPTHHGKKHHASTPPAEGTPAAKPAASSAPTRPGGVDKLA
ncbi:hypothetical protein [Bradyrhizobium sp. 2TAF24]|uniref:hypothetical protein n=1 Tax=Bradyrhizobium sp. 2TAF24 TaxID=3233011 RepID=UPI003F920D6B